MKKVIPMCFIFILALSLVLIGLEKENTQAAYKKKPPKVEEKWKVTIDDINDIGEPCNMTAADSMGGNTYEVSDLVNVRFSPPSKQCACYGFILYINRPAIGDINYAIDFEGITTAIIEQDYDADCCGLPGEDLNLLPDPDFCIANFLNNNLHPSPEYLSASIWIQLNAEAVESLPEGGPYPLPTPESGFIHLSFHSGWNGSYHEVYGFTDVSDLLLTKSNSGNKWIIEVNQPLELMEQYKEEEIYSRGKKEKTRTILRTPLKVLTSAVHFKMTWEKVDLP